MFGSNHMDLLEFENGLIHSLNAMLFALLQGTFHTTVRFTSFMQHLRRWKKLSVVWSVAIGQNKTAATKNRFYSLLYVTSIRTPKRKSFKYWVCPRHSSKYLRGRFCGYKEDHPNCYRWHVDLSWTKRIDFVYASESSLKQERGPNCSGRAFPI